MKLAVAVLLAVSSVSAHALDACSDGPRAISLFVFERNAGVTQEMALDPVKKEIAGDAKKEAFYRTMVDWAYRFPLLDADRITGMMARHCSRQTSSSD